MNVNSHFACYAALQLLNKKLLISIKGEGKFAESWFEIRVHYRLIIYICFCFSVFAMLLFRWPGP